MSDGEFNRALRQAAKLRNKTTMAEAVLELYKTHRPSSVHVAHWELFLDVARRVEALEKAHLASRAGYPGYN